MKRDNLVILIIDDSEDDRFMIERAFRQNGVKDTIHCLDSGERAIAYLSGEGEYADRIKFPFPSLLLTDLKMPREDGFVVLHHLKSNPLWKVIPTLVFSGGQDPDEIKRSYAMGASCYLQKPGGPEEMKRLLKLFYDFWRECHFPEIDTTGKQTKTQSEGKLGTRFDPLQ